MTLPLTDRDVRKLREAMDRLQDAMKALPVRTDLVGVVLLSDVISEAIRLDASILGHADTHPAEGDDGGPFGGSGEIAGYTMDYTSSPKVEPYPDERESCGWHTIRDDERGQR